MLDFPRKGATHGPHCRPTPRPLYRSRSHTRPGRSHLRAPARGLGRPAPSRSRCPAGRSGDGMGGNRHGFDFQNLHRSKQAITLNLRETEGVAIFKQLARDGRRRGGELPARRQAASRYRLREPSRHQPAADLRQHLRLRPERPVSRPARRRPDRAGHGRPHVHHRHSRPGAGARGHSHRRPVLGHPPRPGYPRRPHRAREHRRGQVGAHRPCWRRCSRCSTSRPRAG